MPDPFPFLIDTVLARVRDPGGTLHPHTLCQDLLTRLQQLYNTQARFILLNSLLSIQPHLQLYTLPEAIGDTAEAQGTIILKITHNNRPLDRLSFTKLKAIDPRWPRAVGPRLEGYIQLGYTHLLLWPSLDLLSDVIITSTKLTQDLSTQDPSTPLDIPQQAIPKLLQLLELLLLLRQKDMLSFNTLMQQLNPKERPDGAQPAA